MYIGTDFNEKTDIARILDKIDFTFAISTKSIPYLDDYGISFINSYSPDTLRMNIDSTIMKLREPSLSVDSIIVNHNSRTVALSLNYNGKTVTTVLDDNTKIGV